MNKEEETICKAKIVDLELSLNYKIFSQILIDFRFKTGAEIGISYGGNSEHALLTTEIDNLYGVDAFENSDSTFDFVKKRLFVFKNRFKLFRNNSVDAAISIHETLDFVFINRIYTHEAVLDELKIWFSKIKVGGVIGGSNYGHPNFPGVKQAVDEFFNRFKWDITLSGGGVWWVKKIQISISFIIPAYNCAKTISESIESIMNDNFEQGDEIVICNDFSNDETGDLLYALQVKNRELIVINHSRNKGGASARNTAVENSKHQLIFCLDSDNILEPSSIPKLKEFYIQSCADIASFQQLYYFKEDKEIITHKWIFNEGHISLADCLAGGIVPISSGNYLYSKSSWLKAGGYPEYAGALDAWGFGFKQIASGSKMMVMSDSHYFHRYGHESYWVRDSKIGKISIIALQIIVPYIDLFLEKDIRLMFLKNYRNFWFENLDRKPIRLKDNSTGKKGELIYFLSKKDSIVTVLKYKKYLQIGKYLNLIKKKLRNF